MADIWFHPSAEFEFVNQRDQCIPVYLARGSVFVFLFLCIAFCLCLSFSLSVSLSVFLCVSLAVFLSHSIEVDGRPSEQLIAYYNYSLGIRDIAVFSPPPVCHRASQAYEAAILGANSRSQNRNGFTSTTTTTNTRPKPGGLLATADEHGVTTVLDDVTESAGTDENQDREGMAWREMQMEALNTALHRAGHPSVLAMAKRNRV